MEQVLVEDMGPTTGKLRRQKTDIKAGRMRVFGEAAQR
ncbi:hypothetical protein QG37_01786 [Candidozyma auris]|uniref:Uncharacterized protein n=1 Tax=Candidozyma auris TaxID=498019 RepID=A0A0L0P4G3_CANAR|nr:hypothetical protein QG37_01786 [[Candida] auris]